MSPETSDLTYLYTKNISSCDNWNELNAKPPENAEEVSSTDRNSYVLMETIRQDMEWTEKSYWGFSIIPFDFSLEGETNDFNKACMSTL